MKNIVLLGASLNSGNKGVNALTRGQINLIFDKYGMETKVTILSYTISTKIINDFDYNGKVIKIEEIPCTKKDVISTYLHSVSFGANNILEIVKNSDMVLDISEGDSFSDIYGYKRFVQHSLIKMTALNEKTKLVIMPQTLGPFNRKPVKFIAKHILNKADKVFVRDDISKKIAEEDLGIKREIIYSPDMAFYMKPSEKISIDKFIKDDECIKVGINVSALLYNGGYNGKNMFNLKADYKVLVDTIIEKFASMDNVKVILIPHVMTEEFEVEDDFRVCKKIADEFNKKSNFKIYTVDKYYREDELKAIISGCDFFMGSRMHACIGAISTLVPTAPIAYSRKFIGIWEKIGLGFCVTDPREEGEEEILNKVLQIFSDRKNVKDKLTVEIPELRNKIEKIIEIIEE